MSDETSRVVHGTAVVDALRDETPEADSPTEAPVRHTAWRRVRRLLVAVGVLGLVVALVVGGGLWFLTNRYGGNLDRVDAFGAIDESSRPAAATPEDQASAAADPVTFLLVGSDTRAHPAAGELPDGRSDAIMVMRIAADRRHAQVISIPRDSWVDIPGHGMSKINAAYAYGGPSLLVQTVENLTGVRIDHYAAIDFDGIIQVTDQLGGVDVDVAQTTSWGPYTFPAGVDHLDGDQARWYVGQRYGLPGGDLDRVKRQQQYLQAMADKLFSQDVFGDPGRLDSALLTITNAITVDDSLSNGGLLSLAYSLRDIRSEDIAFLTAPTLGTGREGAQSVVYLNTNRADRMWEALRTDSLAGNLAEFSDVGLPAVPN